RLRSALLAAAEARSRQDWSEAERHYEVALARDPMQPVVILQLGHAQRERGRLQAAEATYRRAIAARPGYPQGYLSLGHTLKAQGHSSAAIDA
ncbi:tetratricopeptide repeat protein, partial [Rhodococcus qingshengii]|nr:tetratricopeptide repeat protein [Rhodococcus qingshengii]